MTNNVIEIDVVKPAAQLGYAKIEGFVNGSDFEVIVYQENLQIDYITLDDETVWANNVMHLEEPIVNPIDATLLEDFRMMVATQIRTTRARRR